MDHGLLRDLRRFFLLATLLEPAHGEPERGARGPASDGDPDEPLHPDSRSRKATLQLPDVAFKPASGGLDLPYRFSCCFAHSTSSFTVRTVSSGAIGGRLILFMANTPAPAMSSKNPPATINREAH